ncbi:MlaD family protein [Ferrovibrio sp.]|uniref:MlaD family protein n=1 Tax=Ferrovibrio sp. TaxID=1917215 RepID=UPI002605C295|nr:MlaD family protein [Ferrovibrio sp.]
METRAHHLLIGSFMLVFLTGIVMFVLWLAKSEVDREIARYNIFFTGSVAGLGVGGDVRFNGIKVGSVSQITIDRENTSRVRVTAEVDADTPIRADSEATLQLQGITGVSFVQISPGSRDAPILPVVGGRDASKYPTIHSKPSAIEALVEAAPELFTRAAQVLSDENLQNLSGFIADLRVVSQTLAARQEGIGRAIDSFERTSTDISKVAAAAGDIAGRLDGLISEAERTFKSTNRLLDGDAAEALLEAKTSMRQLGATLVTLQAIAEENRAPLHTLTTDTFGEFRRFFAEARELVLSLSRVAQRLEDDPSAILFGKRDAEYRNEGGTRR